MKTKGETNKKRIEAMLLTAVMVCTLMMALALPAAAATSGTCGENLTWTLDDSGTLTIRGTGMMENYDYGESPWFNVRENIERVVIGDGVATIGNYAFRSCESLTALTIGNSVTTIGDYTFWWCDSLTVVTIPDSVETIGNYAFWGCESLTTLRIGDGVTTIGDVAFYGCHNLTTLAMGKSVKSIGVRAFAECFGLTTITLPVSVERISEGAFAYCNRLTIVYYEGKREQLESIIEGSGNDALLSATLRPKAKYIEYQTGWYIIRSDEAIPGAKMIFVAYKGKEVINMRVLFLDILPNLIMGQQLDFGKADTVKVMIWSKAGVTPFMDMLEITLE